MKNLVFYRETRFLLYKDKTNCIIVLLLRLGQESEAHL